MAGWSFFHSNFMKQKIPHITSLPTVSIKGRVFFRPAWEEKYKMKASEKMNFLWLGVWRDKIPIQPERTEEVYMISPQTPYYAFEAKSI